MKFIVIEDNKEDCQFLINCLNRLLDSLHLNADIEIFSSFDRQAQEAVLKADFLFLDVETPAGNGIHLAMTVRSRGYQGPLVLISRLSLYLQEGYQTKAERFLIKPYTCEQFFLELRGVIQFWAQEECSFYDSRVSGRRIRIREILYIEAFRHKTILHLQNKRQYSCTYPLIYWREFLKSFPFSLAHRSLLVNLNHIASLTARECQLSSGERLPVSRQQSASFENAYFQFLAQRS